MSAQSKYYDWLKMAKQEERLLRLRECASKSPPRTHTIHNDINEDKNLLLLNAFYMVYLTLFYISIRLLLDLLTCIAIPCGRPTSQSNRAVAVHMNLLFYYVSVQNIKII